MNIINMTPHTITLIDNGGNQHEYPSNGQARAKEIKAETFELCGPRHPDDAPYIPAYTLAYGGLSDLPTQQAGTVYIVSIIAAQAAKGEGRTDCFIVTDTVRDEKGQIVAAKGLARI